VLGYDPVLLLPRNAFDLLHPDDQLIAHDTLDRLVANPISIEKVELRVRNAAAQWRVLEIVARNLLADPNVSGIIISARDVTERRVAEIRIREQAALLDNAQDAIMVCDLEGRLLFWSRSAERVYGWKAREALGEIADRLLFASDATRPVAAFKGLIVKGEWIGELKQINRNGEPIVVESRWSLVRSDSGEPHSILIINTDVTETRKLQDKFLRVQRMESVGALAGGIAHDLNNILAPVLIAAELLKEKISDPECQDWLKTLTESAQRGADLIRQILSFARGTGEEIVDMQVRHLIQEHVKILKETFPRSIKIESVVDKSLWLIKANATKLNQVLMNLSVNARDAMPAGGRIRFRARNLVLDELIGPTPADLAAGSYVVVSVADTGTGIPRQSMNRIFEPFFTTKDVSKGTGLGLATALGIVKSHSGALTVASEEGKGTQFDIYLPAFPNQAPAPPLPPKPPVPEGSGQCLLVVDDETPTRDMVRASLQKHGYEVLAAADGSDGLQTFLANTGRIALVITDLEMPVMDGPSFIRSLRAVNPELRIVVLSGLVAADPPQGLGQGPRTQLLEKPCSAEDLLTAVHRGLTAA
jgi:PAS domain S-box-containing protein